MKWKTSKEIIREHGPQYLTDEALFKILLNGVDEASIQFIIKNYTIKELSRMDEPKLLKIKGIGAQSAEKIMATFELARRLEVFVEDPRPKFRSPKDTYNFIYPKVRELKKETMICLYLNTKNQLLKEETIAIGSLNASIVHPREVFKSAIEVSAANIILCHNHPSGDPTPSREDIRVTEKLVEGGKLLGIDILDHIIVGEHRYVSLKEEGFIH